MIDAQIPFSKKTAQRIFSLFDTEKYVPKSFKGLIPENVILAKDNPTDGLHLIWSVGESGRTLYFSKSSGLATGRYPVPNLIFRYCRNVLQIFATSTKKIGRQAPLFHAPFLNVYTTGNICMGNVNVSGTERFENYRTLFSIPSLPIPTTPLSMQDPYRKPLRGNPSMSKISSPFSIIIQKTKRPLTI
jgi:hypothetical protein